MQLTDNSLLRNQCYVDGQWIDAENGKTLAVANRLSDSVSFIDTHNFSETGTASAGTVPPSGIATSNRSRRRFSTGAGTKWLTSPP